MLNEARIVMPQFPSAASIDAHQKLRWSLVEAFGGYTAFNGAGGWLSPDGEVVSDSVVIYDVACDSERDAPFEALRRIAVEAGKALDQRSVYVRYPNGEVDIIAIENPVAATLDRDRVLLDAITSHPDFDNGAQRLVEAIFGTKHLPHPGELWETEAGAKVFVGKRATVLDGGWYVTVVDSGPTHDRPMFEYVVNHDGKVIPHLPGETSPRDLKKIIA